MSHRVDVRIKLISTCKFPTHSIYLLNNLSLFSNFIVLVVPHLYFFFCHSLFHYVLPTRSTIKNRGYVLFIYVSLGFGEIQEGMNKVCQTSRLHVLSITCWLPPKTFIEQRIVVISQCMHNECGMTNG